MVALTLSCDFEWLLALALYNGVLQTKWEEILSFCSDEFEWVCVCMRALFLNISKSLLQKYASVKRANVSLLVATVQIVSFHYWKLKRNMSILKMNSVDLDSVGEMWACVCVNTCCTFWWIQKKAKKGNVLPVDEIVNWHGEASWNLHAFKWKTEFYIYDHIRLVYAHILNLGVKINIDRNA